MKTSNLTHQQRQQRQMIRNAHLQCSIADLQIIHKYRMAKQRNFDADVLAEMIHELQITQR